MGIILVIIMKFFLFQVNGDLKLLKLLQEAGYGIQKAKQYGTIMNSLQEEKIMQAASQEDIMLSDFL